MRAMNIPVKKLEIEDLEQISGGSTAIGPRILYANDTLIQSTSFTTEQAVTMGKVYNDVFEKVKDFFAGVPKLCADTKVMPVIISHITSLHC